MKKTLAIVFAYIKAQCQEFCKALDVMDVIELSHLIKWPDRDTLRETLPTSFHRFFKKCCIIIDCTEVFVERPSDLMA